MSPTEFLDRKFFHSKKPRNCWMCGCHLTRHTASVDHLKPRSKGGSNAAENYKLACKPCNSARGNESIPQSLARELKGRAKPRRRDLSQLVAAIQRSRANE